MPNYYQTRQFAPDQIKGLTAEIIAREYKIDWQPRVVRQRKLLQVSSLEFVDYAIPCHELAHKLKITPSLLATRLANLIREESAGNLMLGIESVDGYVNFQLSGTMLKQMQREALDWYNSPHLLGSHISNIKCLMVGLSIADEDASLGTTERTHSYLEQIFKTFGVATENSYLISDYSNVITEALYEVLSKTSSDNQLDLYRSIRRFLSDPKQLSEDSEVGGAHKKLCIQWGLANGKRYSLHEGLVFESQISTKVHSFLDKHESAASFEILKDEASRAVYYIGEYDTISLRSANGVLQMPAYILYMLDKEIRHNDDANALIVMGSHRLSILISTYIQSLVKELRSSRKVVYFDPRVSKADISELWAKAPELDILFSDIGNFLQSLSTDGLTDKLKRQAVLTLLDSPVGFSEFVAEISLPQLFDSVSQATEALELTQT